MSNAARDVINVEPPSKEVAPVTDAASAAISMIERAARDPNVDVDKFERLLRMKREVEAEEAKRAYNAAMAACQKEMPAVVRKATNTQTNSKYATLESVADAITPIYTKHGFGLSFDTADSPLPNHYRVTCEITHEAGHVAHRHADIPIDAAGIAGKVNKTATHAFGSTMSYGRRYLTMLIFNVATKNEDDDGNAAGQPPADVEYLKAEGERVAREEGFAALGLWWSKTLTPADRKALGADALNELKKIAEG